VDAFPSTSPLTGSPDAFPGRAYRAADENGLLQAGDVWSLVCDRDARKYCTAELGTVLIWLGCVPAIDSDSE
jgi:hypothetical protein